MKEIVFKIQGSAAEPYIATFTKDGNNLTAHCTCPAGSFGQYCKHRLGILKGQTKSIVSENINDVEIIISWLKGSDVEDAMKAVEEAEKSYEQANKKYKAAKKKLAKALMD